MPGPTAESPLALLLEDPARTPFPGAREVVSWREDDEPELLAELEARRALRVALERRGVWHGRWAELDADRPPRSLRPSRRRRLWSEGRPFAVPGFATAALPEWRNELHAAVVRGRDLGRPDGLRAWLARELGGRGARFRVVGDAPLADPERDVARVQLADERFDDLWCKVGRLSTHPVDASLRLRFSFGAEGDDDASTDEARHRAAAALARAVLPELREVLALEEPWAGLEAAAQAPLAPSQPIVYWNAPNGGALFHHDAFGADDADGQRGVLFVQLVGRTAWLALSTADLARRVEEYAEALAEGGQPWVADDLAAAGLPLEALLALVADRGALFGELALPDQGRLGPLCNRGPEFTAWLADSGHGVVLHPGDALALPNHGFARTALHSVFCASDGPNLALSLGLREDAGRRR